MPPSVQKPESWYLWRGAAIPWQRSIRLRLRATFPMFPQPAAPSSNGWRANRCQVWKSCGQSDAPLSALRGDDVKTCNFPPDCPAGRMTETRMNLAELNKVAEAMVAPGKGILAADE